MPKEKIPAIVLKLAEQADTPNKEPLDWHVTNDHVSIVFADGRKWIFDRTSISNESIEENTAEANTPATKSKRKEK